ncbi:hypothetical protein [Halorussus amylolyticus]|uniref:hypothetical protein n=1 Tax=Halorussus amylolyticus TaxID=1126242 RepID=UPI001EE45875|nr:hypothetical protein [Halorussus amylolyticus]
MLALLALAPVVLFAAGRSLYAGVVTTVNVLLIFGSIYLLTSPVESEDAGEHQNEESTV